MCDVTSTAVSCSEYFEYFPGMSSKCLFQSFVTIPPVPVTAGAIIHMTSHIRCVCILKLLYFSFPSACFYMAFLSAAIATSISLHIFSFLFLTIISGLFTITPLCVYLLIP